MSILNFISDKRKYKEKTNLCFSMNIQNPRHENECLILPMNEKAIDSVFFIFYFLF